MADAFPTSGGAPTATGPRVRWLNVALWAVQILLALQFLFAGGMKVFAADAYISFTGWAADVPPGLLLFIGLAELAGAAGLMLPRATHIQPRLTVFAALGLLAVMVLAAGFHASRGEWSNIGVNVVLGALAAFVAYGRWRLAP